MRLWVLEPGGGALPTPLPLDLEGMLASQPGGERGHNP